MEERLARQEVSVSRGRGNSALRRWERGVGYRRVATPPGANRARFAQMRASPPISNGNVAESNFPHLAREREREREREWGTDLAVAAARSRPRKNVFRRSSCRFRPLGLVPRTHSDCEIYCTFGLDPSSWNLVTLPEYLQSRQYLY